MTSKQPAQHRWGDPRRYWPRIRLLTAVLLAVWLLVTLGVPWFARDLNRWQVSHMPVGLWMASQGAIGIYLALIAVYAGVSDLLERWLERRDAAPAPERAEHG